MTLNFNVPAAAGNGTWFVYVDLDPAFNINEDRDDNNVTVSSRKLLVNC